MQCDKIKPLLTAAPASSEEGQHYESHGRGLIYGDFEGKVNY